MFEVYTEGNKLAASADTFSWFLRKSGTGTTTTRASGNSSPSSARVPNGGISYINKLVAIRIDGGYGAAPLSGDLNNFFFCTDAPIGTGFSYYIYDRLTNAQVSNSGLEVRDASDTLVFSANYRPAKILAMLGTPTGQGYTPSGFYADPTSATFTGKTLAFACLSFAGHNRSGPLGADRCNNIEGIYDGLDYCDNWQGNNDGKLYGAAISGSTVTATPVSFDDVIVDYGPGTKMDIDAARDATEWQIPSKIFVLDVTGVPLGQTFF